MTSRRRRRAEKRLTARRAAWAALPDTARRGTKRPGSLSGAK